MDPSGGESSIGGVTAGENLGQRSAMQTPTSVLQSMVENLERLEIKEKMEKEEKEKQKEIRKNMEEEAKEKKKEKKEIRQQKQETRALAQAEMERRAKMAANEARVKAARKADAMAEEAVASAETEEGMEKANANAEGGGVASVKAEEGAKTIDLAHGGLEVKTDSSGGESSVELKAGGRPATVERRKAQESAVKMSKVKRAKKKAANKMKAMAEKAAWAEVGQLAMTTKARAMEAAKIAKSKAEEAEEAAKIAKSKAAEAEEAARVAQSNTDEAAKAKEAADEVRRLKEKVTEWAQCDEELFAAKFPSFWNKLYTGVGATFQQTTFPAMRHTYPVAGCSTKAMETLQAMSVKVTSIKECLHWPLEVFGIIAARDVLDHKRNIIFHRPRSNCQTITQDDRYLALTGPTRAIAVSTDPSYIEVSLKVKGKTKSEDKDLSEFVVMFRSGCCLQSGYPSRLSTLKLDFGHIARSVEATVWIKIIGGSWPDGFRGAFSAGTSGHDDLLVKLLDFGNDELPVDADGVIKLSRRVVSVQLEKNLKVSVMACPVNEGHGAESSEAVLKPQRAGISPAGIKLSVGSCSMEVSVAWSCFRHE